MARRSQCSSTGDNPYHPNYLPPHYREEYRLAIDELVEADLDGYYEFLKQADVVDFLSPPEIDYIQGSVQFPQQSSNTEHPYLQSDGDGSSDTYWPVHSDLEAPGLDLGWPQFLHSSGPTEVTTLVNPPEPDMPSIKEQARRLIKNAQQVIGIVMDMFTDVDIFADILSAAMRNVAVYIILDEQNANHFINMVNNCRTNLQAIQFLRVRVVSGITYHCRSGKSFKGQMMDRFLLTDCRAVLSGNYSFMWSFEKLHRCMAHLFLGQLVSTFDEEFRILFAQSQPLIIENAPPQMEEFGLLPRRTYPNIKTGLHREPRKFLSMDIPSQDDWPRHPHDDRMEVDWRGMQLKRQDSMPVHADMYNRGLPPQSRIDASYDQAHPWLPKLDNSPYKRHSYAEGGQGRYSSPFMQPPGPPERDIPNRQLHRAPQLNMGLGPESEYSGYDKFWNQDYHPIDSCSEKSYLPDLGPSDSFDPVANYLSSTRRDFDHAPDKLQIPGDFPQIRRSSSGQVYPCRTSPTPSNPMEDNLQESNADRKDPLVKKGLRNWRINSFLSAHDNPADEGPSLTPPLTQDPFDETPYPVEFSAPKIPNVREFRVPAIARASQIPNYAKTTLSEQTKRLTEEAVQAAALAPAPVKDPKQLNPDRNPTSALIAETRTQSPLTLSERKSPALPVETKTTPCPSESSSTTTDGDKPEEQEQKESISGLLRREESFRRKYNPGIQRSSRLRSSLIFSSLEQQNSSDTKTSSEQQDEEGEKKETRPTLLSQKRTREPFKWTPIVKPATNADKTEGEEMTKEESAHDSTQKPNEPSPKDTEQKDVPPLTSGPKPSKPEPPSFRTPASFLDMNDPDQRLMFFKELAAKRKAAKGALAEKGSETAPKAPDVESNKLQKPVQKPPENRPISSSDSKDELQNKAVKVDATQSCTNEQTDTSTDSEKMQQKISQLAAPRHISEDTQSHEKPELPKPSAKDVTKEATENAPETLVSSEASSQDSTSQDLDASVEMSSKLICNKGDSQSNKSDVNSPLTTTEENTSPELTISLESSSSDCKLPETTILSTSSCPAEDGSKDITTPCQVELYISEEPSQQPPSVQPAEHTAEELVEPSEIESTSATKSLDVQDQPSALPESSTDVDLGTSLLSTDPSKNNSEEASCLQEPESAEPDDTTQSSLPTDTKANAPDPLTPDTPEPVTTTPSAEGVPPNMVPPPAEDPLRQETPKCEPDQTELEMVESEEKDIVKPVSVTGDVKTSASSESLSSSGTVEMCTSTESEHTSTPTSVSAENGLESKSIEKNTVDDVNLVGPNVDLTQTSVSQSEDDETVVKDSVQETLRSEETNDQEEQSQKTDIKADEAPPPSPQPKQPKSRYHSSTANVISSSNLRDDTKLLLEQISANSQSRNEMTKEAAVTDDEKEDEADKKASEGVKSKGQGKQKTTEERQILLEKIQSMRKERKAYSRFEMAP